MIAYHNPDNLRKIIISSSLKTCTGLENSAKYHADKLSMSMMKEDANIAKRDNAIIKMKQHHPIE